MSTRAPEAGTGPRIADLLAQAAKALRRSDVDAPEREARTLWASVADMHPAQVWLVRETPAVPAQRAAFQRLVDRRVAGEPLAYVVGKAAFRWLELHVDSRVLIPRPETEGLVERVLFWGAERFGPEASWGRAADLGTGSGAVALSLAVEGRFEAVVATDVSADALEVAAANVRRVAPATPVELRRGSLLEPLGDERCAALVANLPYVASEEWALLDPSVREFEPRVALFGGAEGLDASRALLETGGAYLRPGGLLALELDFRRAPAVQQLAAATGWRARVEGDLFGRPRYLLATREDMQ